MGMTDKQFDSYKSLLLDLMKKAVKHGEEKETMKELIEKLEKELNNP